MIRFLAVPKPGPPAAGAASAAKDRAELRKGSTDTPSAAWAQRSRNRRRDWGSRVRKGLFMVVSFYYEGCVIERLRFRRGTGGSPVVFQIGTRAGRPCHIRRYCTKINSRELKSTH